MKPFLFSFVFGLVVLLSSGQEPEIAHGADPESEQGNSVAADNSDASLTAPELIEKYGYPVETHEVVTGDGYILEVHRIPHGKRCGPGGDKRVVWLQHGLLGDSSNWLVAGPEKGLAYNMADECYDVWMGNFRGNTYSKRHLVFHPIVNKEAFWSFSWNEMGMHDLPASFDYLLNHTQVDSFYYVGHSMGTTAFWICMSERPEYNQKIKLMSAFAPIAYTKSMISPIRLLAPFVTVIDWLSSMVGMYELFPSNAFMEFIGKTTCHQKSPFKAICSNVIFLLCGYNTDQLDMDLLPTIMGHVPAGSSVGNIIHYAQEINSGKFRKFDYGWLANRRIYGQFTPPDYDLSKITVPVALYYGANDWLAVKKDVERLADGLPNLQKLHRVNHDKYNHLDFLWAKDNLELINNITIDFMAQY